MNPNEKGFIAEQRVILRATEKGYMVSRPLRDDCRYDLIFDDNDSLKRIQVKYADGKPSHSTGAVPLNLAKNNKKSGSKYKEYTYSSDDVDVVLAYFPAFDKFCWFDIEDFTGKAHIYVRFEPPANGQKKGINLAIDYDW